MRCLYEGDLYYFSASTLAALLDVPKAKAYEILRHLKAEELVRPVEAGKYLLLGFQPERVLSNPLFIATRLAHPAYVSFWSALHFHGLTEQVPRTVLVATTRKHRPLNFNGARFVFVRLAPHKFFGYQREVIADLPVLVAEVEKALVDSLDQLRYAGGLLEVTKALYYAREQLDLERLVDYANRMRNRSLGSRLGYLLNQLGQPVEGLDISQSFVLLDPEAKAHGSYDQRWRVRVNVSEKELMAWRES
jgi:predicted transcriptional regulator of viral defense system